MTLPLEHGLLCAHTPKTAGTSFRQALLDELGKEHVVCDYGKGNPTTTPSVEQHYYATKDCYRMGQQLTSFSQRFCLTGHFSLPRYSAFFPASNVVIFFRDPLQQVLSNYAHRRRVNGFDGSLEDFCKLSTSRDVQAKTLSSFPLYLLGYIGLQEHYAESLAAINGLYDLSLQECSTNVNKDRAASGGGAYTCSAEDESVIREFNQRDFALYEKASGLFLQRRQLEGDGQSFVHGCVKEQTARKVVGWAMRFDDDKPVELIINVNGEQVAKVRACDFNLSLKGWNSARLGFAGFTYLFKQPLAETDQVECRVSETGQLLFKG